MARSPKTIDPVKAYSVNSMFDIVRQRFAGLLGLSFHGQRDIYEVLGYKKLLTIADFVLLYQRNPIASRIIRAFPQATWRDPITIKDGAGDGTEKGTDNYSPFADAVHDLLNKFRVKQALERADRMSSVGQYGVLYMGFADGVDPRMPLTGKPRLSYLVPFGEDNITISQWDLDKRSARFGKPMLYTLRTGNRGGGTGQQSAVVSFPAHYTRCIHIAEFLDDDENYGTPRLMPVFNQLKDLEKLLGSSAETFWLNARGGLALNADKDFAISPEALTDMKDQAEEFGNQLRRTLAMQGVQATPLNHTIPQPKENFDALIDTIAGAEGMPRRLLTGSERGELASSQDENNWSARINERQKNFATPFILQPFIDCMIATGNLPQPNDGWWRAEWPDASAMSALTVAQIGERKANALRLYGSTAGAEDIVPVEEFRTDFLGLPPSSEYEVPDEEPLDENDPEVVEQFGTPDTGLQATALNGTQIASLTAIVEAVGAKTLDPESAVQLILIGFPTVDEETARAMIKPMMSIEPPAPPPQLMLPTGAQDAQEAGDDAAPSDTTAKPSKEATANVLEKVIAILTTNSRPRTLYVRRDVLNADAIRAHFRKQGLDFMVPADEMHVTIAFSRTAVDWMKISNDWANNDKTGNLTVTPGGARQMDVYGPRKDTLVLLFNCTELAWRWQTIKDAGATWDWGDYQPHISITYNFVYSNDEKRDAAMAKFKPYTGPIELGPEIFQEVSDNWKDDITENRRK